MKLDSKVLVGVAMLAAAGSASAQVALPNTGNSSLVFYSFDTSFANGIGGVSLTTNLGVTYDAFVSAAAGLSNGQQLDYVLPSFSTTYPSFTNMNWGVTAGDSISSNGDALSVLTTAAALPTTQNGGINNATVNQNRFYGDINSACGAATSCAGTPQDLQWAGPLDTTNGSQDLWWGSNFQGSVGFTTTAIGVSSTLAFYEVAQNANGGSAAATTTSLNGVWSIFNNGTDYVARFTSSNSSTPVPLPAAVWLLLSGIAGMGAVARRGRQTLAA